MTEHTNDSKSVKLLLSAGLWLALMFNSILAQSKTDFLNDYIPISVYASFNYYDKGKIDFGDINDAPVKIGILSFPSYSYGFSLLLHKNKNWVHYINFHLRPLIDNTDFEINSNQNTDNTSFRIVMDSDYIFSIGVKSNYFIGNKTFLYNSLNLGRYVEYGSVYGHLSSRSENDIFEIIKVNPYNSNWFHFNVEFGFGHFFKTKLALIETYIYYNISFRNLYSGYVLVNGIINKPYNHLVGYFEQSGNFLGVGLNISPKKWW